MDGKEGCGQEDGGINNPHTNFTEYAEGIPPSKQDGKGEREVTEKQTDIRNEFPNEMHINLCFIIITNQSNSWNEIHLRSTTRDPIMAG